MWIKVKRAFYGDEKGVKAGDVIKVTDARGRQLVNRNLAEETTAPADAAAETDGDAGGGEKQAAKPDNKQAQKPDNKSAA